MSLIHTVEKEKQDVMSHKTDAGIKDGEWRDRVVALVSLSFCLVWFLVPGRSRKLNGISRADGAVVA